MQRGSVVFDPGMEGGFGNPPGAGFVGEDRLRGTQASQGAVAGHLVDLEEAENLQPRRHALRRAVGCADGDRTGTVDGIHQALLITEGARPTAPAGKAHDRRAPRFEKGRLAGRRCDAAGGGAVKGGAGDVPIAKILRVTHADATHYWLLLRESMFSLGALR